MKAIGVDCWIEEEELRKEHFHPTDKACEFKSQGLLREELSELRDHA